MTLESYIPSIASKRRNRVYKLRYWVDPEKLNIYML